VNIPELTEIVFFDKTKSLTFVRQFIGRLARIGGARQKTVVFATHDMMIEHRDHQIELDVWDEKYEELKPKEMLELANGRCLPPFDPNKSNLHKFLSPKEIFDLVREIKNRAVFERGALKVDDASLLSSFDNWKAVAKHCSRLKKLKLDDAGSLEIPASDPTNLPRGGSSKTGRKASGSELPQGKSQKDELHKLRRAVNALYGMLYECACKSALTNNNANSLSDVLKILKSHNAFDAWSEKKSKIDYPLIENVANGMRDGLVPLLAQNMVAAVGHQHYPILNPFMLSDTPRHTPPELVNEIFDKLSEKVWEDSSQTFLDPACGTGMFIAECAKRLILKGHAPENVIRRIFGWAQTELFAGQARLNLKRVFKDVAKYSLTDDELRTIIYKDALAYERGEDMEFDVIVGNPPYQAPQEATGKRGSGDTLWNKFVQKSIQSLLKNEGYLCFVHPAGWRKPQSQRSQFLGMFQMLAHDNHLMFLSIHNTKDGMKTFGAGTRYDWYVMQKGSRGVTRVMTEKKESIEVPLRGLKWLPNSMIEEVVGLMGNGGEVLFTCQYHTQNGAKKGLISTSSNSEFCYPLVHSTTKKGVRYYWTCRNDLEHFTTPKAIFGESGINDVIIDVKGEYGMTQGAMAIPIENQEDGEKLKEFLMSDSFKETLSACSWSNFRIDWRMFRDFKKGFWRQQENE